MSKRVLIVEDNALNMELTQDLLSIAAFEVLCATNGEEGVRMAQTHLPDIILMDVAMPGLDGLQATLLLKNDPRTRHIPIIALTAHAMVGDQEKAFGAGCDAYVTKPIHTRDFLALVQHFADGKRLPSAAGDADIARIEEAWDELGEEEETPTLILPPPRSEPTAKVVTLPEIEMPAEEEVFGVAETLTPQVLVVLPDANSLKMAEHVLEEMGCRALTARTGAEAYAIAQRESLYLAVVAAELPDLSGPEVVRLLQRESRSADLPVLMAVKYADGPARRRAFASGANDIIGLPLESDELIRRARVLIQWHAACEEADHVRRDVERSARQRTERMRKALVDREDELAITRESLLRLQREAIDSLGLAAEQFRGMRHMEEARHHLDTLSELCTVLAREANMPEPAVERLQLACRLHDVGNLYLQDRLCLRSDSLDPMELREWRQHTQLGAWLLTRHSTEVMMAGREIALLHHERWDGNGFPQALAGDKIPLECRIVALAHGIDDMLRYGGICDDHPAPMHPVLTISPDDLMNVLVAERKRRYDPDLVDALLVRREEFLFRVERMLSNRGKSAERPTLPRSA
jgi:response regulator RpfG family c-di-GMP phosphodiesterase